MEKYGSFFNAYTGYETLRAECVTEKKHYLAMVDLLIELVFNPLLTPDTFEAEKMVVKREISQKLDRASLAVNTNLSKLINSDSMSPEEDIATLENITHKDVCDFHKKFFVVANSFFLLAGTFSEAEIKELTTALNKGLAQAPEGEPKKVKYKKLKDYERKIVAENKQEVNNTYFDLTFVKEKELTDFYPEMKILHVLYNVGSGSKIFNSLRDRGLSYSTGSGYTLTGAYSEYYIGDNADNDRILEAFDVCLEEMKKICVGDYSEDELTRAKNYAYGALVRGNRVIDDLLGWYGTDFVLDRNFDDYNEYKERILKVTREDIKKVADIFFKKDSWALSILGNDVVGKEKEFEKILDKYFG